MAHDIPFQQLRDKLSEENYGDWSKKTVLLWEEQAIRLAAQDDFRKHPVTVQLAEKSRQEVARIEFVLKEREDLPELERKALFREKKAHQFYLKLFSDDPSKALELIAKNVTQELENV